MVNWWAMTGSNQDVDLMCSRNMGQFLLQNDGAMVLEASTAEKP